MVRSRTSVLTIRRVEEAIRGELLIRSMLIEAIENVREGNKDPNLLIRLADTWSRLR